MLINRYNILPIKLKYFFKYFNLHPRVEGIEDQDNQTATKLRSNCILGVDLLVSYYYSECIFHENNLIVGFLGQAKAHNFLLLKIYYYI